MNHLVIDADKKGVSLNIKELYQYKDLFFILAYRDFRIRYAQTFLGFLWAFLQPFATLLIFTIVFGKAARVDTGEVPYPLFAVCGMTAWSYFAFVMAQSGNSIISAQAMVKKIYFPRLVIPLSKALVGLVDLGIAFIFLIIALIYYGIMPSINIIYLPLFVVIALMAALGVGIFLSALTIRFRDFQHIVPFMVQIGLYATPVAYPSSLLVGNVPEWLSIVYFLNPMAGVVEGFRWCILGGDLPSNYALISFALVFILFFSSLFYFRKVEKVMADIV